MKIICFGMAEIMHLTDLLFKKNLTPRNGLTFPGCDLNLFSHNSWRGPGSSIIDYSCAIRGFEQINRFSFHNYGFSELIFGGPPVGNVMDRHFKPSYLCSSKLFKHLGKLSKKIQQPMRVNANNKIDLKNCWKPVEKMLTCVGQLLKTNGQKLK